MSKKRNIYSRPESETIFEDAFVGCGSGLEPLSPGTPWNIPSILEEDDFTDFEFREL